MANYWFKSLASGAKVTAATVQDISRLAQREADKFGQAVQIYSGADGRKSHRRLSMAKNPVSPFGKLPAKLAVFDTATLKRMAKHYADYDDLSLKSGIHQLKQFTPSQLKQIAETVGRGR